MCNSLFSIYCAIYVCGLHQEAGGNAHIFQYLDEHVRSSQKEYVSVGGDMMGVTDDWMRSESSSIES